MMHSTAASSKVLILFQILCICTFSLLNRACSKTLKIIATVNSVTEVYDAKIVKIEFYMVKLI